MSDDPDALALLHAHDRDERIAAIIGLAGVLLGGAAVAIFHDHEPVPVIGFGTAGASFATGVTLAAIGDHRWGEAVDLYNRRGCR